MIRRRLAVLVGLLMLAGSAAAADEAPLSVDSRSGDRQQLTPGGTADWVIGVSTDVLRLDSLTVSLTYEDAPTVSAAPLSSALTVQLAGCDQRWAQGVCPGREVVLVPLSPLPDATGYRADVPAAVTEVSAGVELLARVRMSETAPQYLAGAGVRVRVWVDARGELTATTSEPIASGNPLPGTGFRLLHYLLLGVTAVISGLVLTRFGHVRPVEFTPRRRSSR